MRPLVRVAGVATLADGSEVTWSVADGRRGRRWRAVTRWPDSLIESLLLEVSVDGRASRLELGTSAGLLTLHPEASGGLHGNVVTTDAIRHLALPWTDDHELEVEPLALSGAVTARRLDRRLAAGERIDVPVVAVGAGLSVREATRRYTRVDAVTWRIEGDDPGRVLSVDDRGLPVWTARGGESVLAREWPLELDHRA
jgi:hypothetical protein